MAWENIEVHKDEVIYLSHVKHYEIVDDDEEHVKWAGIFTIPASSQLQVGDTFLAEGFTYQVDDLEDINGRGEALLVNATEVKNDKSKARRTDADTGEPDV